MDREKVIYDIERCICHVPDACRDCSHYGHGEVIGCMEELLKDALSLLKEQEEEIENLKQTAQSMMEGVCLLKEQEAVKRTSRKGTNGFGIVWTCGACGSDLYPNNAKAKYCSNCGKPILWKGR